MTHSTLLKLQFGQRLVEYERHGLWPIAGAERSACDQVPWTLQYGPLVGWIERFETSKELR